MAVDALQLHHRKRRDVVQSGHIVARPIAIQRRNIEGDVGLDAGNRDRLESAIAYQPPVIGDRTIMRRRCRRQQILHRTGIEHQRVVAAIAAVEKAMQAPVGRHRKYVVAVGRANEIFKTIEEVGANRAGIGSVHQPVDVERRAVDGVVLGATIQVLDAGEQNLRGAINVAPALSVEMPAD